MRILLATAVVLAAGACASGPYQIELMPPPDVYDEAEITPFADSNPIANIPYGGMLFATDRAPATADDDELYYRNARGHIVRLGVGSVTLSGDAITWEEARRISLAKNRTDKYPLTVRDVDELGMLAITRNELNQSLVEDDPPVADEAFAQLVNAKLGTSEVKDIYIYVHGYKVIFENPLLVASELWHFLGYEGVFITYAWPSTPKMLAYLSDAESAHYSGRNLQLFLDYLAATTDVERIHIIGYSMGSRVVITALSRLAARRDDNTIPVGNVALIGSDYDRAMFGAALVDGLLEVPDMLTVYVSGVDKALRLSKRLFRRERLGQIVSGQNLTPEIHRYIDQQPIYFIDVTEAENSDASGGHGYFRKSPWASSDLLMTLRYSLDPEKRGLVRNPDRPVWHFPPDYVERLRGALREAQPGLLD